MGQMASEHTRRASGARGQRMRRQVRPLPVSPWPVVVILLGISLATVVFAQSGRNQGKAPKTSTTKTKSSGSVAGPAPRPGSQTPRSATPSPTKDSTKDNSSDEVDDSDTVRVVSNLVPI